MAELGFGLEAPQSTVGFGTAENSLLGPASQSTHERLTEALGNVNTRFPILGSLGLTIGETPQTPEGEPPLPGFAEFFNAKEKNSPFPGKNHIQVRQQGLDLQGSDLENLILGEALHGLGDDNSDFGTLRDQFILTMDSDQLRFAQEVYDARVQDGEERSFGDWFKFTWVDAMIRGYVAPDADAAFLQHTDVPGGNYTEGNIEVFEKMKELLRGKPLEEIEDEGGDEGEDDVS